MNFDCAEFSHIFGARNFHPLTGISEHKIHSNDINNITNINLEGCHPFVFDPTDRTHGGTGFYIKGSLVFKRRDDLKFNSSNAHESTLIEIILPNKKNIIVGCIYHHPNSKIPVNRFINNYIEPLINSNVSISIHMFIIMSA